MKKHTAADSVKRLAVMIAAALILLGAAGLSGRGTAAQASSGSDSAYSFGGGGGTGTVSASGSGCIDVQFKVNAAFKSVSLVMSGSGSGKTASMKLYKWDKNVVDSAKGTPLAEKEFSGWVNGEEIVLETSQDKGEYVIELRLTGDFSEKAKFTVKTEKTKRVGVTLYTDYYTVKNVSPTGNIVLAEAGGDPFQSVSTNKNYPYKSAPEEYQYPADSAVVQMGVDPTQWAAVDGLGRTLPGYSEVGGKKDKVVGMFYWTWHKGNMQSKAVNVNNIILENPEAIHDYKHKIWAKNNVGSYFWNEPLYGYYTEVDDYVLRKHAELLADAGVDFVLFDCTNGDFTWEDAYLNLLKVWGEAREQGIRTPQVAFMMQFWWDNTNTPSSVKQVYNAIYKNGKYQDQWFYWEGKPLIMCQSSGFNRSDILETEILQFFTWRAGVPSYFGGDGDDSQWGWLHVYPQALYKNSDGSVEMTTVGVCMNADWEKMALCAQNGDHNMGRSFTMQRDFSYSYDYRGKTVVVDKNIENSSFYGLNLQEQFDYAISVDPEIIFVTGWNEWIMGRFDEWCGVPNAFPDQFNDENSRDIEPSKGSLKDYYYYQLVANVRRFKGVNAPAVQETSKTIDIAAGAGQWDDPGIVTYNHYTKNTYARDAKMWGVKYTGDAIRNDFRTAKVSFDADNIYFYIETVDGITPSTDANWMRLLIDTGAATATSTDWEEFEYIIGRENPSGDKMAVEHSTGGWAWEKTGDASFTVSGNILQLAVPRAALGLGDTSAPLNFGFKWCDNNLEGGDIMTLYTEGDAAPGGRFTFVFSSDAAAAVPPSTDAPGPDGTATPGPGSDDPGAETGPSGGNTLSTVVIIMCCVAAALAVTTAVVVLKKNKSK